MKEVLLINVDLIKKLLESPISSEEISKNTGINMQQIRSYRCNDNQAPLIEIGEMRLKLATVLTKEAIKQNLSSDREEFLEKQDIFRLFNHPEIDTATVEKKIDIKPSVFVAYRDYARDDEKIGLIRLSVVMGLITLTNSF